MISRRTFIAAGLAGTAALVVARWLQRPHSRATAAARRALDADGEAIMTAIVPVLLAGALPTAVGERTAAIAETLTHIDAAIAGLPISACSSPTRIESSTRSPLRARRRIAQSTFCRAGA